MDKTLNRSLQKSSAKSGSVSTPSCPQCNGLGFVIANVPVDHPDFGRRIPCACQQERQQRYVSQIWKTRLPRRFHDLSLGSFPHHLEGKQYAWAECVRYARERPPASLLLLGDVGVGKTGLAVGVAQELAAQGCNILFTCIVDMLGELRNCFDDRRVSFDTKFAALKNAQFLIVDDFASVNSTAWTQETLYRLINHRYNEMLPTAFTVDVTDTQLAQIITPRTADRVFEMTRGWRVVVGGANLRRLEKKELPHV